MADTENEDVENQATDTENENTESQEVPFSNILNDISNNLDIIRNAARGARARMPIKYVIEDIASKSDNLINGRDGLNDRVEKNGIKQMADSVAVFSQSIRTIRTILGRYQQSEIEKESIEASAAADITNITPYYDSTISSPRISFIDANSKWQLRTPVWPMFGRFNIDRGRDSSLRTTQYGVADAVPKDTASLNYSNIMGQIPSVDVRMVDRLWHCRVEARAATYNQLANPDELVKLAVNDTDNSRPVLSLYLPHGHEGTGSGSMGYRPFFTDKIAHPSELPGLSTEFGSTFGGAWVGRPYDRNINQTVGTEAHPVYPPYTTRADRDLDGVFITFQKTRIFENSASASKGTYGNLYAPSTSIKIVENNTHWDDRVTVFLPRGGRVTASIVDADGNTFSRDVMWGSYPHVLMREQKYSYHNNATGKDIFTYTDHPELTRGGIVFSGGRANKYGTYINSLQCIYGVTDSSGKFWANNMHTGSGFLFREPASSYGYSYNTVDTVNEDGDHWLKWEDCMMARAINQASYTLNWGTGSNNDIADRWVSRNVMIPISIVGVWFGLSSDAENAILNWG